MPCLPTSWGWKQCSALWTVTLQLAVKIGRDSDGNRQTEDFIVGPAADAMGAQRAVDRIARAAAGSVAAPALSS